MTRICTDGQLIAERFRIVRFIAEGGMGEVYEAEDQILGENVALKFLAQRAGDDADVLRRFSREVQLARKVTHPNVCRLHDVYRHTFDQKRGGRSEAVFVTMELLPGETLEARLERHGPYTEDETLAIANQLAAALTAAHDAGVIHRDFKTSNVMLVPRSGGGDERVVVTDFGLARSLATGSGTHRLTGEVRMMGTPDYMAPEQLRGDDAGPRADIYALGVVLFEMVTGERPYEAENTMGLLVKRVSEPPRAPRSLVPDISARFEEAILGCLELDPEARLPTAYDVVGVLSGVSVDRLRDWTGPVPSLPSVASSTSGRGIGSRWLLPAGLIAIALAVALVWWSRGNGGSEPTGPLAPMQLTTAPGLELDPAFSPDGKSLVYSGDESRAFELYVQSLTPGGGKTQLTFGGTQAFEPAWSPDGRWIVYHAATAGGIWRVPAGGGEPERLAGFGSRPAFAPDGKTIVFQSESLPTLADTSAPALARSRLWLLDLEGGEPRPLTEAGRPAGGHAAPNWSPSGHQIVFTASRRDSSEIWSIDPRGDDLVPLVQEPESAYDPVFAADGSAVYFSARLRQVNSLWRVPVSRRSGEALGPPEQVSNIGLASIRQLAVGASGSAAYSALATTSNLWSLPVDAEGVPTGPPRALTTGSGRNNRAVFSPDGRRLAYDHWRLGVNIDLWVMDLATGSSRQITTDAISNGQSSWLPDGESLMFHSTRDDRRGLWEVDLATASIEAVLALEDDVDWARLSPDGERIAYHARSGGSVVNVWVRSLDDGLPQRLTSAAELAGFPVWSPDGKYLAYQLKQAEDSHVMVIDAQGGEPQQLTSGAGQSWPFGFSPDGDKVVFAGQRSGEWNLWWVSRTSGEARRLTDVGKLGTYVRYPSWSPTGDQIVFELAETVGDVWMLDALR